MTATYPEFSGKRALITGGTQGIGKAIAARLAQNGAAVYLNYSHDDRTARESLAEFRLAGYSAEICKADISSPEAVGKMLEELHQAGPLDYLVCNAAYQEKTGFFDTDLALLQKTFGINVFGNFNVLKGVALKMVETRHPGAVVICSSGHARQVFNGTFAYDVSKAALNHFMQCTALELIPNRIRVNAIEIGWTHTPGERRWFSEEAQTALSRTIPIGRSAEPDEIAAVAEFLLSEQSSYVVGSLYGVDGGFALRPNPNT